MEQVSDRYAEHAVKEIGKGYVPGGLAALKKEYPEAYEEMEDKLKRNWSIRGVNSYVDNLIRGLKAIGYWNEKG